MSKKLPIVTPFIYLGLINEDGRVDSEYAEFEKKFGYGISPEMAFVLHRLGVLIDPFRMNYFHTVYSL